MLIAPESVLLELQQQIVQLLHGLTNHRGERPMFSTFSDRQLSMAALTALQIAVGEPVWPADRPIPVSTRRQFVGPFVEEER